MKSKNGNLVLTLQNHQDLSNLTLDPVTHKEELDCDLPCVKKGIQVYEAHPDSGLHSPSQLNVSEPNDLLDNVYSFIICQLTSLAPLKQSIVDLMLEMCSLGI